MICRGHSARTSSSAAAALPRHASLQSGPQSLARVGRALGSPGRSRGPDVLHRGHYGKVGRVGSELRLKVVSVLGVVVTLVTMVVMLVVLVSIHLEGARREPGGGVVVLPGVHRVPRVHRPGPGGAPPLLLVR